MASWIFRNTVYHTWGWLTWRREPLTVPQLYKAKGSPPQGNSTLLQFIWVPSPQPPFSSLPVLQLCCWLTSAGQSSAFHWNTAAKGQQNSPGLGGNCALKNKMRMLRVKCKQRQEQFLGSTGVEGNCGAWILSCLKQQGWSWFSDRQVSCFPFPSPTAVLTFSLIYSGEKGFN